MKQEKGLSLRGARNSRSKGLGRIATQNDQFIEVRDHVARQQGMIATQGGERRIKREDSQVAAQEERIEGPRYLRRYLDAN